MADNLYVHFPFCRRKCTYCALHSRAGANAEKRRAYVAALAEAVRRLCEQMTDGETFSTVYFGGGSPALCDLRPLFDALRPRLSVLPAPGTRHQAPGTRRQAPGAEFTVELHPLDVTDDLLKALRDGGVNRISMGV